jgi:hypothetical protein
MEQGNEALRTIQATGKNPVPVDFMLWAGRRPHPPVTAPNLRPHILIALRAHTLDREVDAITPVIIKWPVRSTAPKMSEAIRTVTG